MVEIRELLQNAQKKAYQAIHFVMVETYWQIGRRIVEEEQAGNSNAEYGKFLIKELSKQLSLEFGKGFLQAVLWNMRQFYLTFPTFEILSTLRRELSWSHYRAIMPNLAQSWQEKNTFFGNKKRANKSPKHF